MSWLNAPLGTLMIGGPWNDGALPPGRPLLVHVLAGRDSTGMAIAACGLRQEHRSNGWALIVNDYQRAKIASGEWPHCAECAQQQKEES